MKKRPRINKNAICSSDNYRESKKLSLHIQKKVQTVISSKIEKTTISYKIIKVFGKDLKVTIEEYYEHCYEYGF